MGGGNGGRIAPGAKGGKEWGRGVNGGVNCGRAERRVELLFRQKGGFVVIFMEQI